MRIAIVTPVYPPYRGGIGTVAAGDARLLRAAGNDVAVVTPDCHRGARHDDGVVRLRPLFAWGNAAVLSGVISALRGFDVIHLHVAFYGSDVLVALAALAWRTPLVVTFHMRPKASGWLGAVFALYRACLEPFVLFVARAVIVSTSEYADANGIRHRSRTVVPFCVDTSHFTPHSEAGRLATADGEGFVPKGVACRTAAGEICEPLRRSATGERRDDPEMSFRNSPHIVFVGGMDAAHYFKGVDVLLRACAQLDVPWRLTLVGDGERRAEFAALAQTLGIAPRVRFAGSLPFAQLPDAYRAADIHVLPSIDRSEAFGIVTLEAMACGVPSIVSNLPGVRSVIVPGITGLLAAPGDSASLAAAMRELLVNRERRVKMSTASRARALAEFSQETYTKRLGDVYRLYIRR